MKVKITFNDGNTTTCTLNKFQLKNWKSLEKHSGSSVTKVEVLDK